eukprot:TRINITY_DN4233_c0_g2_i1.p1 TRINITY_DN4233_c0_g2~~TRINITY_DN4233_c0_g2_i1.p1  ORF type:complete len:269 (+),score=9.05 TRINITY_DN4233_c0_g2_i1:71-877(+)
MGDVVADVDICGICHGSLDEGDVLVLSCSGRHRFHRPCIQQWSRVSGECPFDREQLPMRDFNPNYKRSILIYFGGVALSSTILNSCRAPWQDYNMWNIIDIFFGRDLLFQNIAWRWRIIHVVVLDSSLLAYRMWMQPMLLEWHLSFILMHRAVRVAHYFLRKNLPQDHEIKSYMTSTNFFILKIGSSLLGYPFSDLLCPYYHRAGGSFSRVLALNKKHVVKGLHILRRGLIQHCHHIYQHAWHRLFLVQQWTVRRSAKLLFPYIGIHF